MTGRKYFACQEAIIGKVIVQEMLRQRDAQGTGIEKELRMSGRHFIWKLHTMMEKEEKAQIGEGWSLAKA